MEIGRGRAVVRDEQLVGREPAVAFARELEAERCERTGIEALARFEIPQRAGERGRRACLRALRASTSSLVPKLRLVPIQKLLVANRGEIAVRIFRTCRELDIATVAVAASDDVGSLHARSADELVEISGYLDSEEHIRAAKQTGADAIHPGYGFLAERASFAEAVDAAGLTWVGPPAEALRLGGDKLTAKRIAREAGVPTLPEGTAEEIGFPLVVKASAGGGGRGMRVVRDPAELDDALAAAEREAVAAFGDGTLYCERYLERPRHIEVQLLADAHGTCRCARRARLLGAASSPEGARGSSGATSRPVRCETRCWRPRWRSAGRSATESAGTVEFVVDGDEFFFLELNGRIQVEHPVTEAVTGLDLIAEQLRIAAGEPLATDCYKVDGHAVEVRIYAEDPRTFLPQTGRVERLSLASRSSGRRRRRRG